MCSSQNFYFQPLGMKLVRLLVLPFPYFVYTMYANRLPIHPSWWYLVIHITTQPYLIPGLNTESNLFHFLFVTEKYFLNKLSYDLLQAKYTDPQTKLYYALAEEFSTIRSLPMDIAAGYLALRRANNPMGWLWLVFWSSCCCKVSVPQSICVQAVVPWLWYFVATLSPPL